VEGVGDHGCEYMTGGKIAILGPIGRNFAAGMSGGMAYVYDPDGSLEANLNAEMVQLEGLDDEDLEWLQAMLQAHIDATDSAVAQRIMNDWNNNVKHFTKVMPRDYKRVLEAVAEAKASGATGSAIDEAIMAAAGA
jgi:glutamate synthase (NADPH/NADH) large chain